MATKNVTHIVLDCGSSMSGIIFPPPMTSNIGVPCSKFDVARRLVSLILQRKLLFSAKDDVGMLCLCNDHQNVGIANDAKDSESGLMYCSWKPSTVSIDMVRRIQILRSATATKYTTTDDVLEAIEAACGVLSHYFVKGRKIDRIKDSLRNEGVTLLVCIVGQNIKRCGSEKEKDSFQQALQRLVHGTGGDILSHEELENHLTVTRRPTVAQSAKCRLNLELSEAVSIPVNVYLYTKVTSLPPLSKLWLGYHPGSSKTAPSPPSLPAQDDRKRRHAEVDSDDNDRQNIKCRVIAGLDGVKLRRIYEKIDDLDCLAVDAQEQSKAYRYGQQYVPVTRLEETTLRMRSKKKIAILGSIPRRLLLRHWITDQVECVAAAPGDARATLAMSSLIHGTAELDYLLICRYVWRDDVGPKLVVLQPKISGYGEYFYLLKLPFCEDMRSVLVRAMSKEISQNKLDSIIALIGEMQLFRDCTSSSSANELAHPKKCFSPTQRKFYRMLMKKLCDRAMPQGRQNSWDNRVSEPLLTYQSWDNRKLLPAILTVANCFNLERKTLGPGRGDVIPGLFWRAGGEEKSSFGKSRHPLEADAVRIIGEEKNEVEIGPEASVVNSSTSTGNDGRLTSRERGEAKKYDSLHVTTAQPVLDLHAMHAVREVDLTERAVAEMCGVIKKLLQESLGYELLDKAVYCLQALRDVCVKDLEWSAFNQFLTELKDICVGPQLHGSQFGRPTNTAGSRYGKFWAMISERNLGLISRADVPESDCPVRAEVAQSFFTTSGPSECGQKSSDDHSSEGVDDLLALVE